MKLTDILAACFADTPVSIVDTGRINMPTIYESTAGQVLDDPEAAAYELDGNISIGIEAHSGNLLMFVCRAEGPTQIQNEVLVDRIDRLTYGFDPYDYRDSYGEPGGAVCQIADMLANDPEALAESLDDMAESASCEEERTTARELAGEVRALAA